MKLSFPFKRKLLKLCNVIILKCKRLYLVLLYSEISMLPCFTEVEATPACTDLWEGRYKEYLTKARELIDVDLDKEEKSVEFELLNQHYKYVSILFCTKSVIQFLPTLTRNMAHELHDSCSTALMNLSRQRGSSVRYTPRPASSSASARQLPRT